MQPRIDRSRPAVSHPTCERFAQHALAAASKPAPDLADFTEAVARHGVEGLNKEAFARPISAVQHLPSWPP